MIYAKSEDNAIQLKDHIDFMTDKLTQGKTPRAFDKLFLMEAYMKYNKKYTTITTRDAKVIKVAKRANTSCAYEVIKKHSDAVSGDFFAHKNISKDYSIEAESILKSTFCTEEKSDIEKYINSHI